MNKYIILFCISITTVAPAMHKEDNHIPQSYAVTIADKAPVTRENCLEALNLTSYIKETKDKVLFIDRDHRCMSYDKNGGTELRYFDNKVKKHIDEYKKIACVLNSSKYDAENKKLDYETTATIQYFAYSPFKVHYILSSFESEDSDLSPILNQIDDIYEKADKYKITEQYKKIDNKNVDDSGDNGHNAFKKIAFVCFLSQAIALPSFPLPEWRDAIQVFLLLCCIFM